MNASDGIRVTLSELIEMRHRVREVQLFSTPGQRSPLVGLHHSKLRGRGVDFDQVRVYQAGDDVRTIDWRVTARTQEPHTKLFHEERERPIFIMVEQSRRLFFGSAQQFNSLLADVSTKIFDRFDDETIIHPGHGDSTTIGVERPQLAQWRARGW